MSRSGLEAVFLEHRERLLGFLRAHGAGDEASDLLQELWLRIAAAPPGPIGQPLSYLYRAANNLILDRHRSQRQAAKRDADWTEATVDPPPSEEQRLIARQQLARVQAALDALGPRAATIFRRYRIDAMQQKDIARELGVSLSTVESDLRRAYAAMVALRRQLDEV